MSGDMMDFHGPPQIKDPLGPEDYKDLMAFWSSSAPGSRQGPQKYDDGKPPVYLVFRYLWDSIESMAHVVDYGAKKYPSVDNFQGHQDQIPQKYLSAALRHLGARAQGELKDPESGMDHLGHALVSIAFCCWWDAQEKEEK